MIEEITAAGGHVYQIGIALKAVCECGEILGSVQIIILVKGVKAVASRQ